MSVFKIEALLTRDFCRFSMTVIVAFAGAQLSRAQLSDDTKSDISPKIKQKQVCHDFTVHYPVQAGPSSGRNQTKFEFPGIEKISDGQLLASYVDELQDPTPPWAASPTCGRLLLRRSSDVGRTWSKPTLFLDTPLDDRHFYTRQLGNGELLAFFWVQPASLGMIDSLFNYVSISQDGGRTWADPIRFRTGQQSGSTPTQPTIAGGSSLTCPPIILPDGSLAMAVTALLPESNPPVEIGILRSRDNGRTWGDYTTVASDPDRNFVEPVVVRLASRKWIVVTRTEVPLTPGTTHPYKIGPTLICTSADEGRTWSKPKRLPLEFTWSESANPFIMQTETGVVVFAVNTGTAFSYDEGESWIPQDINLGYYPNLLEIEPGTLISLACGMSGKVLSLTKPQAGIKPASGATAPLRDKKQLAANANPSNDASVELERIDGVVRVVRVRPSRDSQISPMLAQPSQPLLAVGRAVSEHGPIIAAIHRSTKGEWRQPLMVSALPGIAGDPMLVQARDGTILCVFPTTTENDRRTMLTISSDGGTTWTQPTSITTDDNKNVRFTTPPIECKDDSWLVAGVADEVGGHSRIAVFDSHDDGRKWRLVAECPSLNNSHQLLEPSLTLTRDGRWVVLVRESDHTKGGMNILVTISKDRGKTWSQLKDTGIEGRNPEIVELLDGYFIVLAESDDQSFQTAFAWDELSHFMVRDLACGFCVRIGGRKWLARGSGIDLAGEINNLAQVPLEVDEIERCSCRLPIRLFNFMAIGKIKPWKVRAA
jgi:hypothetical protein